MNINATLLGQLVVIHCIVVGLLQVWRIRQAGVSENKDTLLFIFAWLVPVFGALCLGLVTVFDCNHRSIEAKN